MPYKTPISLNDAAISLTAPEPERRPGRVRRLQKTRLACALGLLLLGPVTTFALELGEASMKSGLGQSLLVEIPYRLAANETLTPLCVGLAPAADAARALPTYARASRIAVSSTHIEIRGDARVLDPLIGLNVEVQCATTPHLVRRYELFVDPPTRVPAVLHAATEGSAPLSFAQSQPVVTSATTALRNESTASTGVADELRASPSQRARGQAGGNLTQGQTYVVVRGDTLSGIAARVAERTTIRDAADAIFAANPDAFRRGNRDLLEEGRSITIPIMTTGSAMQLAAPPAPLADAAAVAAAQPMSAVDLPPPETNSEPVPRPAALPDVVVPVAADPPAATATAAAPSAPSAPAEIAPRAEVAAEAASTGPAGGIPTWLTIVLAFGAGILVSLSLRFIRRREPEPVVPNETKVHGSHPQQLVDPVAGIDVVEGQLATTHVKRIAVSGVSAVTPTDLEDLATAIGPVDSVDLDIGAPTADEPVAATIEEDVATALMPEVETAAAVQQPPPDPKPDFAHQMVDDEQMTMTIAELDMLREDYEAEHTMTQEANKALRDALADLKATQASRAASADAPTMEMQQQSEAEQTQTLLQTGKLRAAR
jgi:hypothetical protein